MSLKQNFKKFQVSGKGGRGKGVDVPSKIPMHDDENSTDDAVYQRHEMVQLYESDN